MKKFVNICTIFITIITSFLVVMPNVHAEVLATINDPEGLNIRVGPGVNYDIVTALSYRTSITLVSTEKYEGSGCNDGWYQLNYGGSTNRYICSSDVVVSQTGTVTSGSYYKSTSYGTRINEDYAVVRTSPDGSSKGIIFMGTPVKIIEKSYATSVCPESWVKVSYYNDQTGYVCKRLISSYEEITSVDEAYKETLKSKGFPDSYIPFLTYLHKLHNNWVFEKIDTGIDFNEAISEETGKNYIQTTESNYIIDNIVRENPNWYAANSSVVAFYLDPRNYLTERNIFAFEKLNYDSNYHTIETVKSIFNGTFLATGDYASYFINAGKTYSVSPIHLATRIKQEGSLDPSYASVNGKATTINGLTYNGQNLDGVYNYFNIGAFQDSITDSAVTRGLAVAKGLIPGYDNTPWDTPQKAIDAGASLLGNAYISKGQYTLYFEKFNTSPTAHYQHFTNQYMTNIIAPLGEALSTYYAYSDLNLLDTAFVFAIPVYKNMPDEFTSHPVTGDTNNDLKEIVIDGKKLASFDKDVTSYVYYVPETKDKITIDAKVSSSTASIIGIGDITLNDNETKHSISVTSQVGTTKTYTITFIKVEIKDKTLEDLINELDVKTNDTYISGISLNTKATSLINMIKESNPLVTVTVKDKDNKEKNNEILKTGDKITFELNDEKLEYKIVIKGDINGDGKIDSSDLLKILKYILGYTKLENESLYACDTDYNSTVNSKDLLRIQKYILGYITFK